MDRKVKFLMDYFELLVSEGTLQVWTITPTDAEFLVKGLEQIEQEQRTKEFAI